MVRIFVHHCDCRQVLLLVFAISAGYSARAAEPTAVIAVRLTNGSTISGHVDAESTEHELVLRRTTPHVMLRSRIQWHTVVEVRAGEAILSAVELKQQLPQYASAGVPSLFTHSASVRWRNDGNAAAFLQRGIVTVGSDDPSVGSGVSRRVKSLQLISQAASWDNDAETDGLSVLVRPMDQWGRVVPVNGQLDLKLLGMSHSQGGQAQLSRSPVDFPQLESWFQTVRTTDFTEAGAMYQLEFRRFRPARDVAVVPVGMLNGRLSVPGTGTFAASEDLTVLRPYSPLRDFHQMYHNSRRLPRELQD